MARLGSQLALRDGQPVPQTQQDVDLRKLDEGRAAKQLPIPAPGSPPTGRHHACCGLRPARTQDLDAFTAFVSRLSAETSYRRFFSPVCRLPLAHARMLLASETSRGAWVVTDYNMIVGHGCWTVVGPSTAEVAVVVEDRVQGRGLGRALATAAAREAAASGVRLVQFVVQGDNRIVLEAVSRAWPSRKVNWSEGLATVTVAHADVMVNPGITTSGNCAFRSPGDRALVAL